MKMIATTEGQVIKISLSKEFSKFPGPRYEWQGKNSGEVFLKTLLKPKFLEAESLGQQLIVNLDGTEGYSSAFLDGSFGELSREFSENRVLKTLRFITTDEPYLEEEIKTYMKQPQK